MGSAISKEHKSKTKSSNNRNNRSARPLQRTMTLADDENNCPVNDGSNVNLLLLGLTDSGKSTLLKQIKCALNAKSQQFCTHPIPAF